MSSPPPVRILLVNPNTSSSITSLLSPVIDSLSLSAHIQPTYFTSPTPGIPSINSPDDAAESARVCLPHLVSLLPHHDCFLVACYSQHPLVSQLQLECEKLSAAATKGSGGTGARKYVTGIFEASVLASLSLLNPAASANEHFGIVSTGQVWEAALTTAVHEFLGAANVERYAGTETTGLNADQLHGLPEAEVREKMMGATKRLLRRRGEGAGSVSAICLGCAGMVGLDEAVRAACVEELGEEEGKRVHIVDGVKAGVVQLFGMAKGGF